MMRLFILLLGVCSSAFGAQVGAPAADFALQDSQEEFVKLSDQRGSVVYLDFWASWCLPCLKSFPWMNEMQQRFGSEGFKVIAINLDEKRADADRFLAKVPAQFQVVFDPRATLAKAYGIKGMPSSFLIDRGGTLRFERVGFRESSRDEVESAIRQLIARP